MAFRAFLFVLVSVFAAGVGAHGDPFRVAILVNATPITDFEISARTDLLRALSGGSDGGIDAETLRGQAIEALIDEALQIDFAREQGVLPARNVADQVFANIASNNGQSVSEFSQRLRSQGIDVPAFKSRLLPQQAWNAILGATSRAQIVVSDEDLDERWAEIQSARGITERQLTEVYLAGGSRSQANTIAAKMRSDGDFGLFARATSRSPRASQNGDMGWVRDRDLSNAARAAVRGLAAGEVTHAVPGDGGYYIYGVRAVRPVGSAFVEDVYNVRQLFVALEAMGQSPGDAQKLQLLQTVFRRVDSCERFDQAVEIYGEAEQPLNGNFTLRQLPPQVAGVVLATEIGAFSQLVPQPGGASIFADCGKSERSEPQTKDMVRSTMSSENVAVAGATLMRNLRRRAYIEYR